MHCGLMEYSVIYNAADMSLLYHLSSLPPNPANASIEFGSALRPAVAVLPTTAPCTASKDSVHFCSAVYLFFSRVCLRVMVKSPQLQPNKSTYLDSSSSLMPTWSIFPSTRPSRMSPISISSTSAISTFSCCRQCQLNSD